jgi:L-2,4-diaminobutyrate decarboxylase
MNEQPLYFLNSENRVAVEALLADVLRVGLDFKVRHQVNHFQGVDDLIQKYVVDLPVEGCDTAQVIQSIEEMLGDSINFSSSMFMGFPDAGNSVAGLMGSLIESMCQQNLINSDFCARAATFVEISTVRWLRELVGYSIPDQLCGVEDVGGVATTGGTCSNMYGLLMARKNAYPTAYQNGLPTGAKPRILIPADITHYSVAAAVGLLGFGTDSILKIPTDAFAMDLNRLRDTMHRCIDNGEDIVAVVANIGDSRTLTIDNLERLCEVVREIAPTTWIHADACNGGQLLFSNKYRQRLKGIELADSIALDPHKVLNVSYTLSYFLFKDPKQAKGFWSSSTLIMRDLWAMGQLTPNIGTKSWSSLKLYLLIRHLGTQKLAEIIDQRIEVAQRLREMLGGNRKFLLVTQSSDVNSVPFIYVGGGSLAPQHLYRLNEKIYENMLRDGGFYVHGFPIKDDSDCLGDGRKNMLFVLRVMTANPDVTDRHLVDLVDRLIRIGDAVLDSMAEVAL